MKTLKMKILAVTFCMAALFAFGIQNQAGAVGECITQNPNEDFLPGTQTIECPIGTNVCCTKGAQTFLRFD